MIQEDQHIIFVSDAKVTLTKKQEEAMKTGMTEKKIVVTTRRCLLFQSIENVALEIEYNVLDKKKNKEKKTDEKRKRVSINEFPEYQFGVEEDRQCRILLQEEKSVSQYMKKMGLNNYLHSFKGLVVLKNFARHKFQLFSFEHLKSAFSFCRSLICAKAWFTYVKHCEQNSIPINRLWIRILIELANNERSAVLVDPDFFQSGSKDQIRSFFKLLQKISFAHSFQHRYSVINSEAARYAQQIIQAFQDRTTALIFQGAQLTSNTFQSVFSNRLKLSSLIFLNLKDNNLRDQVFINLQQLLKSSKKLCRFDLSENCITLNNISLFISLLKATHIRLTLLMKFNELSDTCIENLEKFVLFSLNPPVDQIDVSFNRFSKKGAWRLFVGNKDHFRFHKYMNFVIYPLPFKVEIFPNDEIEYPIQAPNSNFNIHSALMEQFDQESFMNHTLHEVLPNVKRVIRFIRQLPENKKLPQTRQEIRRTIDLSNKIENFIYAPQQVENIYELGKQMKEFELNIPPTTIFRFRNYISDKLNEALFIRDHYSVKYILMTFEELQINYNEYMPRIEKLNFRDDRVEKIVESIMNLQIDEDIINKELDNVTREGLRLYLEGQGIQVMYYLKYLRDRWVEKLLFEGYSPQNFINEKRTQKNMNFDENVSEKDLTIPYEIRVEKRINENFYLHPWSTNYVALSQLSKSNYEECQKFLAESTKKEKFAIYFQRIQERIEFMKSQFNFFSYSKFKYTYTDLKANSARMLSIYKHLTDKNIYLEIPSWSKKKKVSKEKVVNINKRQKFLRQYHISNYYNINSKCRNAGFFNYKEKFTRYINETFEYELKKVQEQMNKIFQIFQRESKVKNKRIPQLIVSDMIELIKKIRQSAYPRELKEEFYLRVLAWRNGLNMNNTEILKYMPFFTMYLRPPLSLEKYLVAGILQNEKLHLENMPLCMVSDLNKQTQANIKEQEAQFIERDWMGSQKQLIDLMRSDGLVTITVETLTKQKIPLTIAESKTIGEVVANLLSFNEDRIEDFQHFWLYLLVINNEKFTEITLDESQHIGQLLVTYEGKNIIFCFKRRVYCPEWRYVYRNYSNAITNSLYYDVKSQFLLGEFFINDKHVEEIVAGMIIIDVIEDPTRSLKPEQALADYLKHTLKKKYNGYISGRVMNRLMKNKEEIIQSLKDKINEKIMKRQHFSLPDIKISILRSFEDYPEYCSSNYIFSDKNGKQVKVSINSIYIFIETMDDQEKILMEKIITVIPKLKHLAIYYHRQDKHVGTYNLQNNENTIISAALDIIAYCLIRIKMSSSNLYDMHKYELIMNQHFRQSKTKDRAIISQRNSLKKKLQRIGPTILELAQFDYSRYNKYIKGRSARKLYVAALEDNLPLEDIEGMEIKPFQRFQGKNNNFNVFSNIFPNKQAEFNGYKQEDEPPQKKMLDIYDDIPDYKPEEDEEVKYKTPKKQQQPEMKQQQPQTPYQGDRPPETDVITTAKQAGNRRPPPRKNR